jgi:RecG-like helicase
MPIGYSNLVFNEKIAPYFDIYKSYYSSRFPDRSIEFNPIMSSLIIKMLFLEKTYYIHLALIQYIVLDIIYKSNDGITIDKISKETNIEIKYLKETINSLLTSKLIKKSTNNQVRLFINFDFSHPNNKISIKDLILKEENKQEETLKEFLHDRNTIVLSNMYSYIKKNKTFRKDILINEIQPKIPFKVTQEQIENAIKILLDKEDITSVNLKSPYNSNEITETIYQYSE